MSIKKKERKKLQNWPKQSIISERPDITWGWYRIGLTAGEERIYFQGDKKYLIHKLITKVYMAVQVYKILHLNGYI